MDREVSRRGSRWAALWRLARDQHWVVHVRQAERLGIPRRTLEGRAVRESLPRPQPGTVAAPGARITVPMRVSAALLSAGARALASHETAASLWGFGEAQPRLLDILTPPDRRARGLRKVTVRQSSTLLKGDASMVMGLAVTSPARTLCDLAALLPEDALVERVATAIQDGLVDLDSVRERRERLAKLSGGGRLDAALNRLSGMGRTDSPVERELRDLLCAAGLVPHPGTFEVWHRGRLVAVVDIAYPAHRVAIEADSREHHFRMADLYRDDERRNGLAEAGWAVLHFRRRDLRERPGYVIGKVSALVR